MKKFKLLKAGEYMKTFTKTKHLDTRKQKYGSFYLLVLISAYLPTPLSLRRNRQKKSPRELFPVRLAALFNVSLMKSLQTFHERVEQKALATRPMNDFHPDASAIQVLPFEE